MQSNGDDDRTRTFPTFFKGSKIDHYKVLEKIGAGGMGEVYLAEDTKNHRAVALKSLSAGYVYDTKFKKRFEREAEVVSQLDNPNIISIYDIGEFQERPYIAMEFVAGKSLKEVIRDDNITTEFIIDFLRQICSGLGAAHDSGIVHRDLKPSNIMITEQEGIIKILDFGLAKVLDDESIDESGHIKGTLDYMSPEQITGDKISACTDLFSLGVILYEMMCKQKPFKKDNYAFLLYSILHESPLSPREIFDTIPIWLDSMINKLLEKKPGNRFGNVSAVMRYLEKSIDDDKSKTEIVIHKRKKTVTVIELKNLSGDASWDYFCKGITKDLIREIDRRTDLIILDEPDGHQPKDINEIFKLYRSDFTVTGDLLKQGDTINLTLAIYTVKKEIPIFKKHFEGSSQNLFEILTGAAENVSRALSESSGESIRSVEEQMDADVSAYDCYLKAMDQYLPNKPEGLDYAEKMLLKAQKLDSSFTLAYTGLSDVHATKYMAFYDRRPERIELAFEEARKALEMNPNLPEAHRSLGRYYMFLGNFNKAEESFKKAIKIAPKFSVGYRTLAWLKEIQGDDDSALEYAKQALDLDPLDTETLYLIGMIYMDISKYTPALATLHRAIELNPEYGRAYYILGSVYMKLGVLELALENFYLAIEHKGDPNAFVDAGYLYIITGDYKSAQRILEEALKLDFFPFIAHYYLGMLDDTRGDAESADDHYKKSIELAQKYHANDPENNHIIGYLALAHAALGEKRKTLETLEKITDLDDCSGELLLNVARCYALIGDYKKASKCIEQSYSLHAGPSRKEIKYDPHFKELNTQIN